MTPDLKLGILVQDSAYQRPINGNLTAREEGIVKMGQEEAVKAGRMAVEALLEGVRPRVVIKGDVAIAEMPDGRVERYRLSHRIRYGRREPVVGREQAAT